MASASGGFGTGRANGGDVAHGEVAMLEMKVARLAVDPFTNMPVLVLSDESGREAMELGIGVTEASAIATELSKVAMQRPMAHDLMKTLIGECGARVDRVELRDVRRDTCYASIIIERDAARDGAAGGPKVRRRSEVGNSRVLVEIDARPSDAIALALRTGARIRVARKVIEHCRQADEARRAALTSLPLDEAEALRMGLLADDELLACGGEFEGMGERFPALETLRDEDFGKWKM